MEKRRREYPQGFLNKVHELIMEKGAVELTAFICV